MVDVDSNNNAMGDRNNCVFMIKHCELIQIQTHFSCGVEGGVWTDLITAKLNVRSNRSHIFFHPSFPMIYSSSIMIVVKWLFIEYGWMGSAFRHVSCYFSYVLKFDFQHSFNLIWIEIISALCLTCTYLNDFISK